MPWGGMATLPPCSMKRTTDMEPISLPNGFRLLVEPGDRRTEDQPFSEWPEVLTTREAAEALRTCEKTLRALALRGEIQGIRVGRSWRFPRSALIAFIARGGTVRP